MIVTFPHMGNMHIVIRTLLNGLGLQVETPPPVTKKTLELGTRYAPETACLPFKVGLGNFIEALEAGADTIITCGGIGPCRLGYYAEIQKKILQGLNYNFNMIIIEPNLPSVVAVLRQLVRNRTLREIYIAFKLAGAKMNVLDNFEKKIQQLRPWAKNPATVETIWKQAVQAVNKAGTMEAISACQDDYLRRMAKIDVFRGKVPLRIGIVGEIYVMLEPFVNKDIERHLGEMEVEVHRTMFLSDYVNTHIFRRSEAMNQHNDIINLAKPFVGGTIGGHGVKSIGHTIKSKNDGLDGMIHLFPFTCMPEIIAKNLLPYVGLANDIPVLSLSFDEQTGEVGDMTRLEAYIDLLKYRKERNRLQK